MPRAGLDSGQVVRAAAALVDRDGVAALSLSAVAQRLGIKPPSLYAHVGGLDDLRTRLATLAAEQLGDTLAPVAAGLARGDALMAISRAYRGWALEHPGLYTILEAGQPRQEPAVERVLALMLAVLRGYGLEEDEAIHAARSVRAAVHGFVVIEAGGGFGLPVSTAASFDWMLAALDRGMPAARAQA